MAYLAPENQRVYSIAALAEKQRTLLGAVLARGRISLNELVIELKAPEDLVKQWVYNLVQRGQFHGFVDWQKKMLYSREAESLAVQNRCPNCGGELNLAGKGVNQCEYCGVEIFL
jgi:DNA-directed RNA polymerase subunit RPC12/RpoP